MVSTIKKIDLRNGITKNNSYEAFKFPGGEIHVKLSYNLICDLDRNVTDITLVTRLKSSDDIMLTAIVIDTIKKSWDVNIHLHIPYMAYQQADRDFGKGECFSLNTFINILKGLDINSIVLFDPHSEVTPALITSDSKNNIKCTIVTNGSLLVSALNAIDEKWSSAPELRATEFGFYNKKLFNSLVLLSPDAGAYKKIFGLAKSIMWDGGLETANKYRNTKDGNLEVRLSCNDFGGKDVLIVDDICVGGRTFIELAKVLRERNCGKIFLCVSHGIFSNGLEELFDYFDGIYTSESWHSEEEFREMYNTFSNKTGKENHFVTFDLVSNESILKPFKFSATLT